MTDETRVETPAPLPDARAEAKRRFPRREAGLLYVGSRAAFVAGAEWMRAALEVEE